MYIMYTYIRVYIYVYILCLSHNGMENPRTTIKLIGLTITCSKLSYLLPAAGLLFRTADVQICYTQETVVASTDVTGS